MSDRLFRRLGAAVVSLLAVSLITFVALDAAPGDAATALAGEHASGAQLYALRAQMGLDQPLLVRYAAFMQNLLHGDLGRSLVSGRPVAELLLERLPHTVLLALAATLLAALLGSLAGMLAAAAAGSLLDSLLMGAAALGLAVPTFWSGLLLMLLFAVELRWLPVEGAGGAQHLVLPAVTLALPAAAAIARLMRSALRDVLRSEYIRTAQGKGLTPQRVLLRHGLRNSLIPVVSMLGLHLAYLLSGAFIVENIFAWPGLGRLAVQAIYDRDFPVVLGSSLTVALMVVLVNLAVDVAHGWLDPRLAADAL